jgi:hypothetical protein
MLVARTLTRAQQIWLSAEDAYRLGISFEPGMLHCQMEQADTKLLPVNISETTAARINASMGAATGQAAVKSYGCNDARPTPATKQTTDIQLTPEQLQMLLAQAQAPK